MNKRKFPTNLVHLEVKDFDVIQGMDWLVGHHVSIDFHKREISMKPLDGKNWFIKAMDYKSKLQLFPRCKRLSFYRKGMLRLPLCSLTD